MCYSSYCYTAVLSWLCDFNLNYYFNSRIDLLKSKTFRTVVVRVFGIKLNLYNYMYKNFIDQHEIGNLRLANKKISHQRSHIKIS